MERAASRIELSDHLGPKGRGAILFGIIAFALIGGVMVALSAYKGAARVPYQVAGSALFAGSVIALALRPGTGSVPRLWFSSVTVTLAIWTGIVFCVRYGIRFETLKPQMGTEVTNDQSVRQVLSNQGVSLSKLPLVRVGIYVASFEFDTAHNVTLHGYTWHVYPPTSPPKLLRGMEFPEAVEGGLEKEPAFRLKRADGNEVVCWKFSVKLRQNFEYERYPFDRQDIWLRLWHADFQEGAMLVPDFEAYPKWEAGKKLGLDPDFVLGDYQIRLTAWSYDAKNYRSAWGFGKYKEKRPYPELHFSIGITRLPTGPTIIHLLPLIVVYILTFTVILFMVKNDDRSFNIVSVISGLFFVTLLNHQQLQEVASSPGHSLLGFASLIMYASFFLVAANALLLAKLDIPWLEWRNNLVSKLVYLPLTGLAMLIVVLQIMV